MLRIVHFEIHADNPSRAVEFYRNVFGWEITQWSGGEYWLVKTGPSNEPGIDGAILKRNAAVQGEGIMAFVCTVDIDDLDKRLAKALSSGATLVTPKMPVPQIGWLAYCKDTEGNIFGMMQADPNAQ